MQSSEQAQQLEQMQQELDALREVAAAAHVERNTLELTLQEQLQLRNNEIQRLQEQLDVVVKTSAEKEDDANVNTAQLDALQAEHEQKQQEMVAQVAALTQEKESGAAALDAKQAEVVELQKQLRESLTKLEQQQQQQQQLQESLATSSATHGKSKGKGKKGKGHKDAEGSRSLLTELSQTKKKLEASKAACKVQEETNAKLQQELVEKEKELSAALESSSSLAELTSAKEGLVDANATLQQQLDEKETELSAAREASSSLEEITKAKEELAKLQAEQMEFHAERQRHTAELQVVQAELTQAAKSLDDAQAQHADAFTEKSQQMDQLQVTLATKAGELQTLTQTHASVKEQLTSVQAQLLRSQRDVKEESEAHAAAKSKAQEELVRW